MRPRGLVLYVYNKRQLALARFKEIIFISEEWGHITFTVVPDNKTTCVVH